MHHRSKNQFLYNLSVHIPIRHCIFTNESEELFILLVILLKLLAMQKSYTVIPIFLFCLSSISATAQQVADTLFSPDISNPVYKKGQGSIVLIDEAHHNFHTKNGRFKAFANIVEKDGYIVQASSELFTTEYLNKGKILVISNA